MGGSARSVVPATAIVVRRWPLQEGAPSNQGQCPRLDASRASQMCPLCARAQALAAALPLGRSRRPIDRSIDQYIKRRRVHRAGNPRRPPPSRSHRGQLQRVRCSYRGAPVLPACVGVGVWRGLLDRGGVPCPQVDMRFITAVDRSTTKPRRAPISMGEFARKPLGWVGPERTVSVTRRNTNAPPTFRSRTVRTDRTGTTAPRPRVVGFD